MRLAWVRISCDWCDWWSEQELRWCDYSDEVDADDLLRDYEQHMQACRGLRLGAVD